MYYMTRSSSVFFFCCCLLFVACGCGCGCRLLDEVSLSSLDGLRTEDGAPWKDLCVVERWIPQNRTLMRMIVTGPEDPKVVNLGSKILLAFDSHPPKSSGRCRKNSRGSWESVPQMYVATLEHGRHGLDSARVKAYRLQHGSADLAEKNWIPFVHAGGLHFVYTPLPHYVIAAHLDCASPSAFKYVESCRLRMTS